MIYRATNRKKRKQKSQISSENEVPTFILRQDGIYLVLIISIFIISYSYIFDEKLDLNGDNTTYYMLAESISQGKGYVWIGSPEYPPTNNFPPGYPAFMTLIMTFISDSFIAQKIANGLLLLTTVLLLYLFTNVLIRNRQLSFIICVFLLLNYFVLDFATMMMSEMMLSLIVILVFYFLTKVENQGNFWKNKYFILVIILSAYGYYVRTAAISLFAGIIFYYLVRRQWKHLLFFCSGYMLLLIPWMIRNNFHGIEGSRYWNQMLQVNPWRPEVGTIGFGELLERSVENMVTLFIQTIPHSLFYSINPHYGQSPTLLNWILGISFFMLIGLGIMKLPSYKFLIIGFFLATAAMLCPWNGGISSRYIIALISLLYLTFIYGLYTILFYLWNKFNIIKSPSPFYILLIIGFSIQPLVTLHHQAVASYPPAYENYIAIAQTVNKQTPQNTVVSCRKPSLFHIYSNRFVFRYTYSLDDRIVINHLIDHHADFVVLEQLGYSSTARYLYPAIQKHPELFQPVIHLKNPDTFLLKFHREKAIEKLNTK